jgi:serine phosphatase RsbU (regulator of sigma subunit)
MNAPTIDELVLLPEPLALQRQYDARNYRVFRWLLGIVLLVSIPLIATGLSHRQRLGPVMLGLDLVAVIFLILVRRERFYQVWFRQILLAFLFVQIVVAKVSSLGTHDVHPLIMLMPLVILFFRMKAGEYLLIYGALWVAGVLPLDARGLPSKDALPTSDTIAAVTSMTVIGLIVALALTQVERRRFLRVWRTEHGRARERLRMREEIEYARKIQLSMVPQVPPELGWLELAAASLPATEVGGDYFDYFRLSPAQLAVVIGDVSGHGLASGLLLSGVRSCLYLLESDLATPVVVLERLNHMVRRTTDRRTYITLLCAVLDRGDDGEVTLTLASAGHPPVLRYARATREFDEVGKGAAPLGTFLETGFEQEQRTLRKGDLLLFYTDGLLEARNGQDQEYGEARLRRTLARASDSRSVRDIRDALLGDLANFKGDAEQVDDITVVVVRVR